jgi:hypothetical protein
MALTQFGQSVGSSNVSADMLGLYCIDITIPLHHLDIGTVDDYKVAYYQWKERFLYNKLLPEFHGYCFTQVGNEPTFRVMSIGGLHSGLKGRHVSIESTICLVDNTLGRGMYNLMVNSKISFTYFIRGDFEIDENGHFKDLVFCGLTAVTEKCPDLYKETIRKIYHMGLRPHASFRGKETIDSIHS